MREFMLRVPSAICGGIVHLVTIVAESKESATMYVGRRYQVAVDSVIVINESGELEFPYFAFGIERELRKS